MKGIIAVSLPQDTDDLEVLESIKASLAHFGYDLLDLNIEYETDCILYRFQRIQDGEKVA